MRGTVSRMKPTFKPRARLPRGAAGIAALAVFAGLLTADCGQDPGTDADDAIPECTFVNPVASGQDPWVVRHEGSYYLVESKNRGIYVYESPKLTDPKQNEVRVWLAPETGWNRGHIWAPELHLIHGRWYIYYAAGAAGPPFIHQRSGVLESEGSDPQGPYVDRGMLYTGDDLATGRDAIWAIDLTVARLNGQLYAVWSGWKENSATDRTPQHLYIAPMSNPWTISGTRVRISSPTETWEDGPELDLNEGATFLLHGGRTFIVYSARESWLPDYRMGQLSLRDGADPLDPASWIKSGPVFAGYGEVYGVGHASFTTSPDSTEDWVVYHSKTAETPGWERVIRLQPFGWKPDGSPDFGTPVPSGEPIPMPSGACAPLS
jgi:GH43 family beta-xylosidase